MKRGAPEEMKGAGVADQGGVCGKTEPPCQTRVGCGLVADGLALRDPQVGRASDRHGQGCD